MTPSTAHSVHDFVIRPLEIVLVIVVAVLVAHFGARAIRRVLGKVAEQAADRSSGDRAGARAVTLVALVGNLWRFFVGVVAFFIILGMLGVDLTPAPRQRHRDRRDDRLRRPVPRPGLPFRLPADDGGPVRHRRHGHRRLGHRVRPITGVVEDVSLRVTRVRAADGSIWYVPNGDIRELANASRGWAKAIVDVPVHAAQLDRAKDVVAEAARAVAAGPRFAAVVHRATRGPRDRRRRRGRLHAAGRPADLDRPARAAGTGPPRGRRRSAGRRGTLAGRHRRRLRRRLTGDRVTG